MKVDCIIKPKPPFLFQLSFPFLPIFIIELQLVLLLLESKWAFQSWIYAITSVILVSYLVSLELHSTTFAYLEKSHRITLVNKVWLLCQLSNQKIGVISTLLKIKRIATSKHKLLQFATVSLNFLGKNQAERLIYILIKYKLYSVDIFGANILVDHNILAFKVFNIKIKKQYAFINSYGITFLIIVWQHG